MSEPLLVLLHLCDSLFPVGSFAHSDGLETATARGEVRTAGDLGAWLDVVLGETIAHLDGPLVARTWQAYHDENFETLDRLDAEAYALRPSASGREAMRAMGARLMKTWDQIRPNARLGSGIVRKLTLPAAFGVVTASADVAKDQAVSAYAYTRLAATVSAAMRLMPLGQHDAHTQLAAALARVPATTAAILADEESALRSFTPALDIAQMRHQYEHSRLFRS